jgi:hypothetical protein
MSVHLEEERAAKIARDGDATADERAHLDACAACWRAQAEAQALQRQLGALRVEAPDLAPAALDRFRAARRRHEARTLLGTLWLGTALAGVLSLAAASVLIAYAKPLLGWAIQALKAAVVLVHALRTLAAHAPGLSAVTVAGLVLAAVLSAVLLGGVAAREIEAGRRA